MSALLVFARFALGRLMTFSWLAALIPGGGLVTAGASVFSAAVSFFSTPLGRWVAIGLVGVALFLAGDIHRARVDHAKWTAAVEEADGERAARDAAIKKQMAAEAQERLAAVQHESDGLKQKVSDYEQALAARGAGNSRRATRDDARQLRGL